MTKLRDKPIQPGFTVLLAWAIMCGLAWLITRQFTTTDGLLSYILLMQLRDDFRNTVEQTP